MMIRMLRAGHLGESAAHVLSQALIQGEDEAAEKGPAGKPLATSQDPDAS